MDVPKFLRGSNGYAGCTFGHAFLPLSSLHAFHSVHRETGAAPGMADVSARRK